MKKIVLTIIAIASLYTAANAQIKNKKGEEILPVAGEYSIGINAVPLLDYFGNLLSGWTGKNTDFKWNYMGNRGAQIFGKYMISETEAYRVGVRIGFNSFSAKNFVTANDTTVGTKPVEDKVSQNELEIMLTAGKEYRRGKGRLQGIYGAEAQIMMRTSSATMTYANSIDAKYNNNPTIPPALSVESTDWAITRGNAPVVAGSSTGITRNTKYNDGTIFGIGARAFVGVEYFFLPKMSLGGEFGWGLMLQSNGKNTRTTEEWDATTSAVKTTEIENGGKTYFGIDTDNFSGCIALQFYF